MSPRWGFNNVAVVVFHFSCHFQLKCQEIHPHSTKIKNDLVQWLLKLAVWVVNTVISLWDNEDILLRFQNHNDTNMLAAENLASWDTSHSERVALNLTLSGLLFLLWNPSFLSINQCFIFISVFSSYTWPTICLLLTLCSLWLEFHYPKHGDKKCIFHNWSSEYFKYLDFFTSSERKHSDN